VDPVSRQINFFPRSRVGEASGLKRDPTQLSNFSLFQPVDSHRSSSVSSSAGYNKPVGSRDVFKSYGNTSHHQCETGSDRKAYTRSLTDNPAFHNPLRLFTAVDHSASEPTFGSREAILWKGVHVNDGGGLQSRMSEDRDDHGKSSLSLLHDRRFLARLSAVCGKTSSVLLDIREVSVTMIV
jgi:hypothetical protein